MKRQDRGRFQAALVVLSLLLSACGPKVYNSLELMPSPAAYSEVKIDPYVGVTAANVLERAQLFYATDRMPARPEDPQEHYNNERGFVLRTGIARTAMDPPVTSWEEARRVTLKADRDETYKMQVTSVSEIGIMPFSITDYMEKPPTQKELAAAGRRFAAEVDAQLAASRNKDIFIYTHGYNVDFDYSTLVSKELQHYLGYQGAFISYNWTATPSQFAYFRDQESALATRRNLRALVEYLSANTRARRIHLIGYSAGSRLVFETAYQIALMPDPKPRLGQMVLISSDLDQAFFLQALEDGLLDTVSDVTLYQSQTDSALAVSRLVYGRQRIGETTDAESVQPAVTARIADLSNLHVIDVTNAEEAGRGNGHWYFQSSPWASSDLFLTLLSDRDPGGRGLVRNPGEVVWRFPPDYLQRLEALAPLN